MIEPGDRIAVGVSGGKDSLTLLFALAEMRRFYPVPYDLIAITVDLGFPGADFSPVEEYCRALGVPYVIERTEIAGVVFDVRKEKNPCSLCAKMRRGAIHSAAKRLGCGKFFRLVLSVPVFDTLPEFCTLLSHSPRVCQMPYGAAAALYQFFRVFPVYDIFLGHDTRYPFDPVEYYRRPGFLAVLI